VSDENFDVVQFPSLIHKNLSVRPVLTRVRKILQVSSDENVEIPFGKLLPDKKKEGTISKNNFSGGGVL
jgi:hypothetical protein